MAEFTLILVIMFLYGVHNQRNKIGEKTQNLIDWVLIVGSLVMMAVLVSPVILEMVR